MTDTTGFCDSDGQIGSRGAVSETRLGAGSRAVPATQVMVRKSGISGYFDIPARSGLGSLKWLGSGLPALLHAAFWTSFVLVMIPHLPPTNLYPAPPVEELGRIKFFHKVEGADRPVASASYCCASGISDNLQQTASPITARAGKFVSHRHVFRRPGRAGARRSGPDRRAKRKYLS